MVRFSVSKLGVKVVSLIWIFNFFNIFNQPPPKHATLTRKRRTTTDAHILGARHTCIGHAWKLLVESFDGSFFCKQAWC